MILELVVCEVGDDGGQGDGGGGGGRRVEKSINWDELDDLPPEWDSGLDDLLSLSTTYWEPGLGPRTPRKVPSAFENNLLEEGRAEEWKGVEEEGRMAETPSAGQLNDMMHDAMHTVNRILYHLERDRGRDITILRKMTMSLGE